MKTAIFNFLVLQAIVWAFVFSSDQTDGSESVNHASLADTWEVVKVANNKDAQFTLHYPTFNKLTLNGDGSYIRLNDDEDFEEGYWNINESKSRLTLKNDREAKEFFIVKMPNSNSETFIIKEYLNETNSRSNLKYELARM